MTEIRIKDEGGDAMTLIDFGDFRSSFYGKSLTEIAEIQRRLPTLTFHDGDILIASYQKTGIRLKQMYVIKHRLTGNVR